MAAIGAIPAHYVPFSPGNLRPDPDVAIITKAEEGEALSARYNHEVRIDSVAGQLVYLHVPADGPPTHIGTLRGEEFDRVLGLIYHRHGGPQEAYVQNGTAPAVGGDAGRLDRQLGCLSHLCLSSFQCMQIQGCGACMIFWCT